MSDCHCRDKLYGAEGCFHTRKKLEKIQRERDELVQICSKEQLIWDKPLSKADSIPSFLKMPTPEALEVFQAAFDNYTDSVPFDGRLVPNQWLINERGITATVAADFEAQIESLQRENEGLIRKLEAIDAGHLAKSGGPTMLLLRELDEARAAAITPEMRERIEATVNLWDLCQRDMNADLARDFAPCAMDLLRDLLGEQG